MGMPAIFRERGWLSARAEIPDAPEVIAGDQGCLLVAGSCSVATRDQNEWLASQGVPIYRLDARELLDEGFEGATMAGAVRARLAAGEHCLLARRRAYYVGACRIGARAEAFPFGSGQE